MRRGPNSDWSNGIRCRASLFAIWAVLVGAAMTPALGQSGPETYEHEIISASGGINWSRAVIGCSAVELDFSGRLVFKSPGSPKQPLLNADFSASNGWSERQMGTLVTSDEEAFHIVLSVWDHFYGTRRPGKYRYVRGKSWVTISAPGCETRHLKVTAKWRPKTLVIKCPGRGS